MTVKQRYFGIVREFNTAHGHGVIEIDDTGETVFVRYSAILGEGMRDLVQGQRVSFEVAHNGHGLNALYVVGE